MAYKIPAGLTLVSDSEFPEARDFVIESFNRFVEKTKADPELVTCKMYNDGSHYVCSVDGENSGERNAIPRTRWDDVFDIIVSEPDFKALRSKTTGELLKKQRRYVRFFMETVYYYDGKEELDAFINRKLYNLLQAKTARKRTFRRKSGLIQWSFFCTFTYDSSKMIEKEFRYSLVRRMNNLHTNYGWIFAGAFERGAKTDRLHFHCLVAVPEKDRGTSRLYLYNRKGYDPDTGRIKNIQSNRYFDNFGRNDFSPVDATDVKSKIEYIMKYISKSEEKMFYSRGIPCYIVMRFKRSDFVATLINVNKRVFIRHVLRDDAVQRVKKTVNDKHGNIKETFAWIRCDAERPSAAAA